MAESTESVPRDRRTSFAVELLRIGVGIVWLLNLVFIVAPANNFFGDFRHTALTFGPTTLGGPALAQYAAGHALVFAWLVALVTGYLAVALILGLTTRFACFVGGVFSAVLLGIQVGSTFVFPGGTDVGEHPLYLLIYFALVVGGAGSAYSMDHWIPLAWARGRAARAARARALVPTVSASGLTTRTFLAYFIAGILIAFGVTVGLVVGIPPGTPGVTPPTTTSYENLTISLNPVNGWPQYSPANFTVPTGLVIFTITDQDMPMNWSACGCVVTGTQNSLELINGTPVHVVSPNNVAHTFNVPNLGLSVYTPGQATVRFTVDLLNPGSFVWFCTAPCGAGANAYNTPPMGTPGYMTGTMTIS
ncbi:MAG TPA: hypothetical protein VKT21_00775 [Thermoplasmata archaeon]|nr:hypothetical protein [Thermoplasmata archaeon]